MSEEKTPHSFGAADESPVTIPPVDEAWTLMQQKLDLKMPVIRHWYNSGWSVAGVGVVGIAITLSIWFLPRPSSHSHIAKSDRAITAPVTNDTPLISPARGSAHGTQDLAPAPITAPASVTAPAIESVHQAVSTPAASASTPVIGQGSTSDATSGKGMTPLVSALRPVTSSSNARRDHLSHATSKTDGRDVLPIPGKKEGPATRKGKASIAKEQLTSTSKNGYRHAAGNGQSSIRSNNQSSSAANNHPPIPASDRKKIPSQVYPEMLLARTSPDFPASSISIADSLLKAIRNSRGTSVIGKSPSTHALNSKATADKKSKPSLQRGPRQLTAGLSIGKNFPIGQQQSASYNINGKGNTLSDYIPAPYFRLYIGDRLYLETILRINSPQYTRSQVIDNSGGDTTRLPGYPSYLQYNTVTLKKLYYTDVPLSLHYRVLRNFYIGAGLQYSRLWGGVANEEIILRPSNGIGADTLISSGVIPLKNNAHAYGKLAKSDWRVLLGVDYNWRRFTLGLRYQQALNTYLPPISAGVSGERNGSIGLFFYYDIWQHGRIK